MKLTQTQQYAIIAIVALLAALFAYSALSKPAAEPQVNSSVFLKSLSSAKEVAIIMDLRGADVTMMRRIMTCGVGFAGSSGLAGKNISVFALEDKNCTHITGIKSLFQCESMYGGKVQLYIMKGNDTSVFYERKMLVLMNERSTTNCSISAKGS